MSFWRHQLFGSTDPARDANWEDPQPRKGFFTDTSICIGCKACEVACKEWNQVPMDRVALTGDSYDNSVSLGANTWRHVAFVEQNATQIEAARESGRRLVELGMPSVRSVHAMTSTPAPASPPSAAIPTTAGAAATATETTRPIPDVRWLIASDVCKHCTHAGCLDVCPTGSLFRTEHGTVVVQDDICNGCGYCVASCPFGVIERRDASTVDLPPGQAGTVAIRNEGVAQKCTLCYDRLQVGDTPACAKACPTTSITYGELDDLREQAQARLAQLHAQGMTEARLYGADPDDGVGGTGSIFLLLDEPEVYGLPPDPIVTTADLPANFRAAGWAATTMLGAAAMAFLADAVVRGVRSDWTSVTGR